jgi:hypothetical protein
MRAASTSFSRPIGLSGKQVRGVGFSETAHHYKQGERKTTCAGKRVVRLGVPDRVGLWNGRKRLQDASLDALLARSLSGREDVFLLLDRSRPIGTQLGILQRISSSLAIHQLPFGM